MAGKGRKLKWCTFSQWDYEGVRLWLEDQARQGWAFTGRAGLFTGWFQPTRRTELRYDVVPARRGRSPQALQGEIEARASQGWAPVDTLWGMDIYASLPCQEAAPLRREEDRAVWRSMLNTQLLWTLAFYLVTALILILGLGDRLPGWGDLTHQWYLSEGRAALCLLLPLAGAGGALWLLWLLWCRGTRLRAEAPPPNIRWVRLRGLCLGGFLLLLLAALALLWTSQVERLWVRGLLWLGLALSLTLPVPLLRGRRRAQLLASGGGVFACLLLAMVLGWAEPSLSPAYTTFSDGSSWLSGAPFAQAAEELAGQEDFYAQYSREETIFLTTERWVLSWSGQGESSARITGQVYRCLPGMAGTVWADLTAETGAQRQENGDLVARSEDHLLCYRRQGNRIYRLQLIGAAAELLSLEEGMDALAGG